MINLHAISEIISDFKLNSLENRLSILHSFIEDHHYLDISVLGQFKAGKSSLLNSLIGKALLPTGVVPVTSAITLISHSDKDRITIYNNEGKRFICKPEDLENYITEKHNPGNEKKIIRIEIETPLADHATGLRFIDTPGLGSRYRSSSETTMNWIPESGIALILVSSIQPVSDADIQLIRETLTHTPYIVIILSKTDLLEGDQIIEIKDFVKKTLWKEFGREFLIIEYSVRKDLAAHKQELLESALIPYLHEKEKIRNHLLDYKYRAIIESAIGYLQIAYAASQKDQAKREELRRYILDERTKDFMIRKELELISSLYKGKSRTIIEEVVLDKHKETLARQLKDQLQEKFNAWAGNISKRTELYENWIKEALHHSLSTLTQTENSVIRNHLHNSREHFGHYTRNFHENLSGKMREIFGLSLPEQEFEIELPRIEQPDIFVRPAFDIHIDMLGPFFPMFLLRKWLKNYFSNQISSEVEKNLSRLVTDLTTNVNTLIDSQQTQTYQFIHSEIMTVEKLLSDTISDSRNISDSLKNLEALKSNEFQFHP